MKVFIPAAGKGTRLGSLTQQTPKALVEIAGKPMLWHLMHKLVAAGFTEIVVNVHHFGDAIVAFLQRNGNFGVKVAVSDETKALLDTGGGLVQAAGLFSSQTPFLVHNVDIMTDMDLAAFYKAHCASDNEATLCVSTRKTSRYLLFDESMQLCGWENRKTGEQIIPVMKPQLTPYAFSGIQMINPEMIPALRTINPPAFPLIPAYLSLITHRKISGMDCRWQYWIDLGKPESLHYASTFLVKKYNL
ncbi:MAG: nucleotidyltransferase family protein [Bacteroidia bacterium]|nr:nucleotidyltransferase family protein [Bacteroidales bacterium]NCD40534.1 nucleotidyltransferase family protein [Bacteroidia bacterium]MDD2321999.1 nucleotidyltransferase family protein [Bacteroidales bacterium]MDD3010044.1 nucleotidyltransferase family protein [Bacteroidales bacterium]MDD3960835.1 nucleotidyltransferase family protein [Bacteroidales bacterium]